MGYHIAGNVGSVQIFVSFVQCLTVQKEKLRNILHSKYVLVTSNFEWAISYVVHM